MAITIGGFNNIDFSAILEAVMTQERAPVARLEADKRALEARNTLLGTLATRLGAVQAAAERLARADSLDVLSATSTRPDMIGVTASGRAVPGTYDVVVSSRAGAQVTATTNTFAATDVVATTGTLQILATSQPPVNIVVTGGMTVRQLADAINAIDAPVSASVIQVAPGSYRLVLTGRTTGADNAFTLTSSLSGGAGLAFGDTNGNNVFGEVGDGNAVEATNASLTVNNVAVTSASNTLTDVVPGATLTLAGQDAGTTVRVDVTRDSARIKGYVNELVTAYNELVTFVGEQRTASLAGNPSLTRDPVLQGLQGRLRATVLGQFDTGSLTRLAAAGVGFDRFGKMTLEERLLDERVAADPGAVQALFAGQDAGDGAFDELAQLVASYTGAGGFIHDARERNTGQLTSITKRIDGLDAQLAIRRAALQKEFIAADQAMSRLSAQVGSLSSMSSQFRIF